jgi:beta-galactosidase
VQNIEGAGGITAPVIFCPHIGQAATWSDWKMKGGLPNPASITRWNASGTAPAGQLRYYQATFQDDRTSTNNAHLIYRVLTDSLSAGCVYVNGHNLGRYPEKIPVKGLYIPECWLLKGENTLTIFDENAMSPARVSIAVEQAASRRDTQTTIPLAILIEKGENHDIAANAFR